MANRLLTELVLQDKNFGQGITVAKQKLDGFQKSGNGAKGVLSGLDNMLGGNLAKFSKMGVVVGAATVAMKGMKEIIQHNTALMDDYDRAQKQVNAAIGAFWTTLGNGNFSSFLNGLDDIIEKAGKARDAMDDLAVTSFYMSNANRDLRTKYQTAMDKARDSSLSKTEREHNLKLAKDYVSQMQKNYKLEYSKGVNAKDTGIASFMANGGYRYKLTDKQIAYYLNPQNGPQIERDAATYERIEALRRETKSGWLTLEEQKKAQEKFKSEINKLVGSELNWETSRYARAYAFQSQRGAKVSKEDREEGKKSGIEIVQGFYDIGHNALEGAENIAQMNRAISKATDTLNTKTTTTTHTSSTSKVTTKIPVEPEIKEDSFAKVNGEFYKYGINLGKEISKGLKDQVSKELKQTTDKGFGLMNFTFDNSVQDAANAIAIKAQDTQAAWSAITSIIQSAGGAMQSLNDQGMQVAGVIAQAIATVALAYSQTLAKDQLSKSNIYAFIAAAAAATISMATTIASIHKATGYANGGIIAGNSFVGDNLIARVNSGEMILNSKQQSNLWKQINHPTNNTNSITNGQVEFKIKGDTLVGVQRNYYKKQSRL